MKRVLRIFAVITLLALPIVASAADSPIPPEMNWTATPPLRGAAEMARISDLLASLVSRGMITTQERDQLVEPYVEIPLGDGRTSLEERVQRYLSSSE